jgi:hypothetical protein
MRSTILRATTATLTVLVVAAVAAVAAVAIGGTAAGDASRPVVLVTDDDGTPDQGSGDRPSSSHDHAHADAATEDRPSRREVRQDDDRRETRDEVVHDGTQTYAAANAGTVTVARDGTTLAISDVTTSPGWTVHVERTTGREVEVTFRRAGERVDIEAEIEHDRVAIRVRER